MNLPITLKPKHIRVRLDPLLGLVIDLFSTPPPYDEAARPVITLQLSESCSCHLLSSLDYILSLPLPTEPYVKLRKQSDRPFQLSKSHFALPRFTNNSPNVERYFTLLRDSQLDFTYEKSIQLKPRSFNDQRYLAGTELRPLTIDLEQRLLTLLSGLDFPKSHFEFILSRLPSASWIHIGLEQHGSSHLIKVYLEYPHLAELPYLRHYAIKYSPSTDILHHSEYIHIPFSGLDSLTDIFTSPINTTRQSPSIVSDASVVSMVMSSFLNEFIPPSRVHEIELLQAIDINTSRISCDLNLYSFELSLAFFDQYLFALADQFSIERTQIYTFIEEHASSVIGHFSYGYHRDNSPFLSVYFTSDHLKNVLP